MSEPAPLLIQLTVAELREIIRAEVEAAVGNGHLKEKDRLLSPDEAAAILGEKKRWLYRHAKNLPFAKRHSRKSLKFSEIGLRRWMASRGV